MHELLRKRLDSSPTFRVKAIPKSSKTEIIGELADGTLKIRIAAPADKGKANAELCSFLAREAGVPQASVAVISGHTAPLKLVRVSGSAK